jgi:eukaryotic-like serine/threonine-protein kinase
MANRVGQQLGNYRLISVLGQGSFADVYLGEHQLLKAKAAIKVLRVQLSGEDAESFLKEAQVIAHLVHPHIVRIFDFAVDEGVYFLVMEYSPNGTLRQRHARGVPLPLKTIVTYINQVADALQYAHDQKLIHRDVKPENILIGRRGELWLSDFGIVLDAQSTLLPVTQGIVGTMAYMAPEQISGKPRFASDQYALGIIVYEWLCGSRPFQGTFYEVANQHMYKPPQPLRERLPGISPAVEEVVMRALAKQHDQRFPSVQAFAHALEQACLSVDPHSTSLSQPMPRLTPGPVTPMPPIPFQVSHPSAPEQSQRFVTPLPPLPSQASIDTHSSAPGQTQYAQTFPPPAPSQSSIRTDSSESQQTQLRIPPSNSDAFIVADRQTQPKASFPVAIPTGQPTHQPTDPPTNRPGPPSKRKRIRNVILITLVILLITAGSVTTFLVANSELFSSSNGIGVSQVADGEYIGISDGTFAFDTEQPDGKLKLQAADKLKAHDVSGAESLWQKAIQENTGDAETLIYLEDQRVLAAHTPYITFIVATYLTSTLSSNNLGRSDLQGAYVAQKEFNEKAKLPGRVQIRLLIANLGDPTLYPLTVAQQVVQVVQADKTIMGVVGWPKSQSTRNAIGVLSKAHISVISPTASYDELTGASRYFFRVTPSNKQQVFVETQYAEHMLHATRAALFVDSSDLYSQEVASDFQQQFVADGNTVAVIENYTVGRSDPLSGSLQDALEHNPDIIYFAGVAADVSPLMAILPTSGPFADIQVLGADRLFGDYPYKILSKLYRLHLTVFNTGHMWEFLGLSSKEPQFYSEYPQDFDPLKQHGTNAFGYTRADSNTMFSYDAMLAFLTASKNALARLPAGQHLFSPDDLRQALTQITGSQAIQGVTGRIAFGPDGNVMDKAVVLVKYTNLGGARIDSVQGTFLGGIV